MSQIPKYILNWRNGEGGDIPVSTELPESGGISPNVLYKLGVVSQDLTISFADPTDTSIANVFTLTFATGSTVPTITWVLPNLVAWADGAAPTLEAGTYYEVSLMDNIVCVVSAVIPTPPVEP